MISESCSLRRAAKKDLHQALCLSEGLWWGSCKQINTSKEEERKDLEIMEKKKKKEVSCLQELLLRHVLSTLRMQATSWDRNPIPTAVVTTASCVLWLRTSRDRAVAVQESWAASASSGFQIPVHRLARAPHLASCAARALVQLSTRCCWCCRGLSDHLSLPSVDISRLRWKLASNLLSESVFWSLLPSRWGGNTVF